MNKIIYLIKKIYLQNIFLLLPITIILFFFFSIEYSPIYKDGAWIIGDKIYGFPLPYIYNNVVSSLERDIIILYLIFDFMIYLLMVGLILFIINKTIIKTRINNKTIDYIKKIIFVLLFIISIIILMYNLTIAIDFHYSISWNLNYYGDSLRFISLYLGLYWL